MMWFEKAVQDNAPLSLISQPSEQVFLESEVLYHPSSLRAVKSERTFKGAFTNDVIRLKGEGVYQKMTLDDGGRGV